MKIEARVFGEDATIVGLERWGNVLYVTYITTSSNDLKNIPVQIKMRYNGEDYIVVGPASPFIKVFSLDLLSVNDVDIEVVNEDGLDFAIMKGEIPNRIPTTVIQILNIGQAGKMNITATINGETVTIIAIQRVGSSAYVTYVDSVNDLYSLQIITDVHNPVIKIAENVTNNE